MKILSIVEATTVNAVAKVTLDFFRAAREALTPEDDVIGSLVTFERVQADSPADGFVAAARNAGIDIDVIPERGRFDFSVISALKKIVEQRRPDIVITNSVKSHFVMWRSQLWKKYPWIAYHHGYTNTDAKMRLYNRFDRWSLPKADLVITVCDAFARQLASEKRIPPEKIRSRHNSVRSRRPAPETEVESVRRQLRLQHDDRVILSIGRLSAEKSHADLIVAFDHVKTRNCKVVLVGDGPERNNLQSVAQNAQRRADIIFVGQISDVGPYYATADVFVLPSHTEGSPNVLLEAMAARVPVLATAVGGVPEIVEHEKSALLVPPGDANALASGIDRLLTDSNLADRLTNEAAEVVARNHSPEVFATALVEIYRSVIDRRNA